MGWLRLHLTVRVKNRTELKELNFKLKNTFDMKNKDSKTRKLRYVFYTLLTCVLCVGCVKTKVVERDVVKIEYDTIYIDNTVIKHSTGFSQFRISKCPYCGGDAYVHEAINGDGGSYTVDCLNEYNEQTDCKRLLYKWYDSFEEAVCAWENAR